MSATLAELYFKQGFPEKAVEVYRQLIEREPDNDRLRRRLAELQDVGPTSGPVPVADRAPAPPPAAAPVEAASSAPSPASRRVALERTIARLEGMLAAIKKG
jgi:pentatricopeptide repeat protein